MNSNQLHRVLASDDELKKANFLGVFADDLVPTTALDYPCCMVINTKPHTHPGEHWVAIYKTKHNKGIYFDSYGFQPYQSKSAKTVLDSCDEWTFNNTQLQSPYSTVCGQYCIFFLTHMARGMTLENIIYLLNDLGDTNANDSFIFHYILQKYSTEINNYKKLDIIDVPFIFSQISVSQT